MYRKHSGTATTRQRLIAILLACTLCACQQGDVETPHANVSTTENRTLLFIGQATEPAVIRSMEDYVQHMGEVPAGFVFYLILSGDVRRTRDELTTMQAFMDRFPGAAVQLALGYGPELTGNLKESLYLLAGGFDPELEALAQWLNSLNRPALLRPLYEFDRGCATYGPPEVYKPAYRYIVDSLRNAGVSNARYAWQSAGPGYAIDNGGMNALLGALSQQLGGALDPLITGLYGMAFEVDTCPIINFYPGDGYVDYFATSYWGDGGVFGQGTDASRDIYQREVRHMFDDARRLGLELMIAESTPAFIGTTSGEASQLWMHDYFDLIEEYDIRVASYIATEWFDEGGNWGSPAFNGFFPPDARIHADTEVARIWRQRTSSSRYLKDGEADLAALLQLTIEPHDLPWRGTAKVNTWPSWAVMAELSPPAVTGHRWLVPATPTGPLAT